MKTSHTSDNTLVMHCYHQSLPLAQVFRISRGAKTSAEVIVVVVRQGKHLGWGEAVPYGRYGESVNSVTEQLLVVAERFTSLEQHQQLNTFLPAGSARNALDCALWDLKARIAGKSVNQLLNLPAISSCQTAQTLSVDNIDAMRASAQKLQNAPVVKVKLDGEGVLEKMQAIHQVCPNSRFIVDANEGWTFDLLKQVASPLSLMNVALIEQPLPDNEDSDLHNFDSPVPLCADESCHTSQTLSQLVGKYQYINVKLDKTGGLTEAVRLVSAAQEQNMGIMVGCMVGSSLAMAPAYALCKQAEFVDLDGPLLVAEDRPQGFNFDQGRMSAAQDLLWGMGTKLPTELQTLISAS